MNRLHCPLPLPMHREPPLHPGPAPDPSEPIDPDPMDEEPLDPGGPHPNPMYHRGTTLHRRRDRWRRAPNATQHGPRTCRPVH
ncbi:hypothetical protein [Caldimonas brevitalea]|uniref:Uncharacterized protein n=1 Tax=Caldimonas brevitalea TaxID=413882 RepID=A0A0G3BY02_9BURK|nr:hypothetical protein [Caldimonas brevitalea]AKJ31415.1 hypothetical protein AAW51_4724 [Caldimonas brevitalea]